MNWQNITVKLTDLQPWQHNPRTMSKKQAQRLLKSWKDLGQFQTIAIGPSDNGSGCPVYDGHQRLSALLAAYGPQYAIDARQSDRALTEDERRYLITQANLPVGAWRFEEIAGWPEAQEWGFDAEMLATWNSDAAALATMLEAEQPQGDADAEPQIDRAVELNEKWQVQRGDLWRIGEHRLYCGDSTKREDVERVMQGERAGACITDPPCGINFDTNYTRFTAPASTQFSGKNKNHPKIENDDKPFDPSAFLDYESVVLFGANFYADKLPIGTWLVWDGRFENGKAWLSDAELAWMKGGQGVYIFSLTSQGMIRPEPVQHPTQKPVSLMQWCIEKSKAGETIYEPFAGSGTTLVACQNLQRKCRAIEISPNYCAVILQRMQDAFPGIEIERVSEAI